MAVKAYASVRFTGDRLEPSLVSDVMSTRPTLSYRKGEDFFVGKHRMRRTGRTGLWLYSTEHSEIDNDLKCHVRSIFNIIIGPSPDGHHYERPKLIKTTILKYELEFSVGLYWHGVLNEVKPSVPPDFLELIALIGGRVDTDFDTDDVPESELARA